MTHGMKRASINGYAREEWFSVYLETGDEHRVPWVKVMVRSKKFKRVLPTSRVNSTLGEKILDIRFWAVPNTKSIVHVSDVLKNMLRSKWSIKTYLDGLPLY